MSGKGWTNLLLSALGAGAVVFLATWCPGPLAGIIKWAVAAVGYTGAVCAGGGGGVAAALVAAGAAALNHLRTSPRDQ